MNKESVWNYPCHRGVEWEEVKKEVFLLERTMPQFSNPEPILIGVIIGLGILALEEATKGLIRAAFRELYGKAKKSREERRKLKVLRKELFLDFLGTDMFVGVRYPWFEKPEQRLSRRDLGSLRGIMEGFIYTLCSLIRKKPSIKKIEDRVDFARNLVVIGGPIPNWYTRNLMYASELDLPCRFRLDVAVDLKNYTPAQLREAAYLEGKPQPEWYIANRDGSVARTLKGEETKPVVVSGKTIRDFFMIMKVPNIAPEAKGSRALVLAGCHGLGTWAAGLSLKELDILEAVEKEAGDGYFQALGSVLANRRGEPDKETIKIGPIIKLCIQN